MSKQKTKKLGYKQYEGLLSKAHQKLEFLAERHQELQSYFIAYVEFKGDNIVFNDWMNKKIKEMKDELQTNDKSNEQHLEASTANQR